MTDKEKLVELKAQLKELRRKAALALFDQSVMYIDSCILKKMTSPGRSMSRGFSPPSSMNSHGFTRRFRLSTLSLPRCQTTWTMTRTAFRQLRRPTISQKLSPQVSCSAPLIYASRTEILCTLPQCGHLIFSVAFQAA
jgi:hypothetical protein